MGNLDLSLDLVSNDAKRLFVAGARKENVGAGSTGVTQRFEGEHKRRRIVESRHRGWEALVRQNFRRLSGLAWGLQCRTKAERTQLKPCSPKMRGDTSFFRLHQLFSFFCWRCGAYSRDRTHGLKGLCRGEPGIGQGYRLNRLKTSLHPFSGGHVGGRPKLLLL